MTTILAEELRAKRAATKRQQAEATAKVQGVLQHRGVPEARWADHVSRIPSAIFEDVDEPVGETTALDMISRLFVHEPRADGLVDEAVRTITARLSMTRLSPEVAATPPPRVPLATWSPERPVTPPRRPRREEAHEAVRQLAREAGREEEPQPDRKTATRRNEPRPAGQDGPQHIPPRNPSPPRAARQRVPPAQPREEEEENDIQETPPDSDPSDSSSDNSTTDTETETTSRSNKGRSKNEKAKERARQHEGTFRHPSVLWDAARWDKEFRKGASLEDLRRQLLRQAKIQEHTAGSYTKDVAEDIAEVLLEIARSPGDPRKGMQILLDMLFRTRAFVEGKGREELEALGRELRDEELPKRFRDAKRQAKKEAKSGNTGTTQQHRNYDRATPAKKTGARQGPKEKSSDGSGRIPDDVWATMSRAQKTAVLRATRRR